MRLKAPNHSIVGVVWGSASFGFFYEVIKYPYFGNENTLKNTLYIMSKRINTLFYATLVYIYSMIFPLLVKTNIFVFDHSKLTL